MVRNAANLDYFYTLWRWSLIKGPGRLIKKIIFGKFLFVKKLILKSCGRWRIQKNLKFFDVDPKMMMVPKWSQWIKEINGMDKMEIWEMSKFWKFFSILVPLWFQKSTKIGTFRKIDRNIGFFVQKWAYFGQFCDFGSKKGTFFQKKKGTIFQKIFGTKKNRLKNPIFLTKIGTFFANSQIGLSRLRTFITTLRAV